MTVLPEIDTDYVNVSDLYISFQAKITGNANKNTLELGLMTDPTVASTKLHHIEGAAKAVDLELTAEELKFLEEPYVPHPLAGVMAQNKRSDASKKHVWSTGDQKIGK